MPSKPKQVAISVPEYIQRLERKEITPEQALELLGDDLAALQAEYADHIATVKEYEGLKNALKAYAEPLAKQLITGDATTVTKGGAKFTLTQGSSDLVWVPELLSELLQEMLVADENRVSGSYMARRLAECRQTMVKPRVFKVEPLKGGSK